MRIDRSRVNVSDVTSGRRLPTVHPGDVLREEFLIPMELSVYALAASIKVPRSRLNEVVLGRRAVTTDTALRLGRYFGTSTKFWRNLQARNYLDMADPTLWPTIELEVEPRSVA